jgi:putative sigma-54 modulation protein
MQIEIKSVHYEVSEEEKKLIEKKLHRIQFMEDHLVSLHFMIVKEKNKFKIEVTIHFRWGNRIFIHVNNFHLHEGIDQLFNKMESRISKEKERVKQH